MFLVMEEKADLLACGNCKYLSYVEHKTGDLKWTMDFQCFKRRRFLLINENNYKIGRKCKYRKN